MSGYGYAHQKRRAWLKARAIGTPCPDCGEMMTTIARMVADHTVPLSTDPTSIADRVHCRICSDRQGGRLSRR